MGRWGDGEMGRWGGESLSCVSRKNSSVFSSIYSTNVLSNRFTKICDL
ncbi:MAG: hypothetical protein F6K36_06965 [Symploca sp. SIO3C6]|nr:hypothetical protein [Symploca sp. SIO3C6]NET05485.1 hypothetical protein [Symploca sp. SIO2B6]